MQYQLEKSQWWPPEALARATALQLAGVVKHAIATVPYYRGRLDAKLADPALIADEAAWAEVPILTRRDIQAAGNSLLSNAIPKSHGKTYALSTSGSTGAPVTVHGTEVTQFLWMALTLRHHLWHNPDFGGKFASIRFVSGSRAQYPQGETYGDWGPAIAPAFLTGPAALLSIATPVPQQIEWLERERPDHLLTYPSNLAALLIHCRKQNMKFPVRGEVQTLSEVLSPEVRRLCREATGLRIVDMYSSQEAGYIALQCPRHEHYHVQCENVRVEVLDASGKPCKPGETGRVVVSTLHNFAMPLVRYAIGDYATAGEPCPCGRGLPVIARIVGRARNMLTLPTGSQIWPYFGGEKLSQLAPIRQYQLVQKSLGELELHLVADRPLTAEELETVRNHINAKIGTEFAIGFAYRDAIPRSASGKFEDFHSELVS